MLGPQKHMKDIDKFKSRFQLLLKILANLEISQFAPEKKKCKRKMSQFVKKQIMISKQILKELDGL